MAGPRSIFVLLLVACVAFTQTSGAGATDAPSTERPFLRSFVSAGSPDALPARPLIKVFDAQWRPRGGFPPPCKAATPIAFLVDVDHPAVENVTVESNEGGSVKVAIVNCGTPADVSSLLLTLTLAHLGNDRPVASVRLPLLADCGGCQQSSAGSIRLLPGGGVEDFVEVDHVPPGYYLFRLSGVLQVRGPGLRREFTLAPEPWPSNIVLFTGDVRRALPGTHRATVTSFRGTNILWDWEDNIVMGVSQAPWILVDLVAHTPSCNAMQPWYVDVNHAEFYAEGQGFQTRVPELSARGSPNKDEYRWHLMPLPAGTTAIRGTLWLDVHSCDRGQPVIAHSLLKVSAPAPPAYNPPASVSPVQVSGKWEVEHLDFQLHSLKLEIRVGAGDSPGSGGCLGPRKPVTLGGLVCAWVSISTAVEQVTLTSPLVVQVAIRVSGGPTIWQGTLPPLSGTFRAKEGAEFSFIWNQRDAAGQQVPPGVYQIFVPSPIEVHYIMAGQSWRETLMDMSMAGDSGFTIP